MSLSLDNNKICNAASASQRRFVRHFVFYQYQNGLIDCKIPESINLLLCEFAPANYVISDHQCVTLRILYVRVTRKVGGDAIGIDFEVSC